MRGSVVDVALNKVLVFFCVLCVRCSSRRGARGRSGTPRAEVCRQFLLARAAALICCRPRPSTTFVKPSPSIAMPGSGRGKAAREGPRRRKGKRGSSDVADDDVDEVHKGSEDNVAADNGARAGDSGSDAGADSDSGSSVGSADVAQVSASPLDYLRLALFGREPPSRLTRELHAVLWSINFGICGVLLALLWYMDGHKFAAGQDAKFESIMDVLAYGVFRLHHAANVDLLFWLTTVSAPFFILGLLVAYVRPGSVPRKTVRTSRTAVVLQNSLRAIGCIFLIEVIMLHNFGSKDSIFKRFPSSLKPLIKPWVRKKKGILVTQGQPFATFCSLVASAGFPLGPFTPAWPTKLAAALGLLVFNGLWWIRDDEGQPPQAQVFAIATYYVGVQAAVALVAPRSMVFAATPPQRVRAVMLNALSFAVIGLYVGQSLPGGGVQFVDNVWAAGLLFVGAIAGSTLR